MGFKLTGTDSNDQSIKASSEFKEEDSGDKQRISNEKECPRHRGKSKRFSQGSRHATEKPVGHACFSNSQKFLQKQNVKES